MGQSAPDLAPPACPNRQGIVSATAAREQQIFMPFHSMHRLRACKKARLSPPWRKARLIGLSLRPSLEVVLQSKLNNPRPYGRRGDLSETGWRRHRSCRVGELRVVEEVEELRPELNRVPLPDPRRL